MSIENLIDLAAKANKSRLGVRYRKPHDYDFCLVQLGDKFPFTMYDRTINGDCGNIYVFKDPRTSTEIFACCIDLPPNWAKFDMHIYTADELVVQYDDGVCFTLTGDKAKEDVFKECLAVLLTSIRLENDIL
jgi:hypothetical protein